MDKGGVLVASPLYQGYYTICVPVLGSTLLFVWTLPLSLLVFGSPGIQGNQMQAPGNQFMVDGVGVQPVQAVPNPSFSSSIRPPSASNAPAMTSSSSQVCCILLYLYKPIA